MSNGIKPPGRLLTSLIVACLTICATISDARSQTPAASDSTLFQKPLGAAKVVHPAPEGAHLLCVPVLTPNKSAWLTIVGAHDEPLNQVSLLIDGQPVDSNSSGHVTFTVANAGAVSLWLSSITGAQLDRHDYSLLPDGVLATSQAAIAVSKLIPQNAASWPALLFAPSFVEPGQTVVLLGSGFDGRPQSDRPLIDGVSAEPISGSASALLVKVPGGFAVGNLKPLVVATRYGDTQEMETDVVHPALEVPDAGQSKGELPGRIAVYGTALPTLVTVHVPSGAAIVSGTAGGQGISDANVVVLPGGTLSFQPITVMVKSRKSPLPTLSIVADAPMLNGGCPAIAPGSSVLQTLDYAILVRLKRRDLALVSRLQELRLLAPGANQTASQLEKAESQLRALSNRHNATAMMIAARQALLQSDGATQGQIQQALDDASGGAYYVLESKLRTVAIVPATTVLTEAPPAKQPRKEVIVIPDVRFKLWPPPEDSQMSQALHLQPIPLPASQGAQEAHAKGAPSQVSKPSANDLKSAPDSKVEKIKPEAANRPQAQSKATDKDVRKAGVGASQKQSLRRGTGTASRRSSRRHHSSKHQST